MENKKIYWFGSILLIVVGVIFTLMILTMKDDKKRLDEALTKLSVEQSVSTTCSTTRDSLIRANKELSKYKTLTQAMVYRDDVTGQLKHKVGDVVRLKNDSAKVVIEDVLIGGGKYNFYVKYRVLLKDNTSREMVPELIY